MERIFVYAILKLIKLLLRQPLLFFNVVILPVPVLFLVISRPLSLSAGEPAFSSLHYPPAHRIPVILSLISLYSRKDGKDQVQHPKDLHQCNCGKEFKVPFMVPPGITAPEHFGKTPETPAYTVDDINDKC